MGQLSLFLRDQVFKICRHNIAQSVFGEHRYANFIKRSRNESAAGKFIMGLIVEVNESAQMIQKHNDEIQSVVSIADLRFCPCKRIRTFTFRGWRDDVIPGVPANIIVLDAGQLRLDDHVIGVINGDMIERRPCKHGDELVHTLRIVKEEKITRLRSRHTEWRGWIGSLRLAFGAALQRIKKYCRAYADADADQQGFARR